MDRKKGAYTSGPIGSTIIRTAIAMVPGTLAMTGYNLADAYFVGRLGKEPLAAMGFTFPVIMLAWCIFHGIGTGVVTTTAQALGGGRKTKASGLVKAGLLLAIGVSIIIAAAGILSGRWVFSQFGAQGTTLDLVMAYMVIWYLGCVTGTLSGLGNSLLIAAGDASMAAMMMMFGMVINAVLDPMLIFGFGFIPAMGIEGAALATVFSQFISAFTVMEIIRRKHQLIHFDPIVFRQLFAAWRTIIRFAVPAIIGMLMMPLGVAVVTRVTAEFGDAAVGAVAAAGRVEALAFVFPMAMGISLVPMIGQNFGGRFYSRIRGIYRFSMRFAVCYLTVMAVVFCLMAETVARWFSPDPDVQKVMTLALQITPWGFAMIEVHRYSGFFYTGCARPAIAAWLNALRIVGLLIPLSMLALLFNYVGLLFVSRLLADVLSGTAGWFIARKLVMQLPADQQPAAPVSRGFLGLGELPPLKKR